MNFKVYISILFLCVAFSSCKKELVYDELKPQILDMFYEGENIQMACDFERKTLLIPSPEGVLSAVDVALFMDIHSPFTLVNPTGELQLGQTYEVKLDEQQFQLQLTSYPVVILNSAQTIVDEPKVPGSLILADGAQLALRHEMGVEYRGNTSLNYEKKSLGFELWSDANGLVKENLPLLGMRSDDDWILDAMYIDPLKCRNALSHQLWMNNVQLPHAVVEGKSACDSRFVEVFLNGSYHGLFALMERVDRKQLELEEYNGQIRGELFKAKDWTPATLYQGVEPFDNNAELWSGFKVKYPDPGDVIDWSGLYDFIDFCANSEDQVFVDEIEEEIDLENCMDYIIYLNLMKAMDNSGKNLYLARQDEDEPMFIVPWDMDAAWGIDWMGANDNNTGGILSNNLFDRLIELDPDEFVEELQERWNELKNDGYDMNLIQDFFSAQVNQHIANGAYDREAMRWPGSPNLYEPDDEVHLMNFIEERHQVLDDYINGL